MAESTLDKIQGAKEIKDMILWSGMTQKEIMELEATMGRAADKNWHYNGKQYGELGPRWDIDREIATVKRGATDAGVHIWRHGYPEQKDYRPTVNQWQPDVSERGE